MHEKGVHCRLIEGSQGERLLREFVDQEGERQKSKGRRCCDVWWGRTSVVDRKLSHSSRGHPCRVGVERRTEEEAEEEEDGHSKWEWWKLPIRSHDGAWSSSRGTPGRLDTRLRP